MASDAKKVTVYTMDYCPYCERAKGLLKQRGVDFTEVRVAEDDDAMWDELFRRSGMRTMPQIFVGDAVLGGYTDLKAQDDRDKLASFKSS
jgi:glutaredoxin 3